LRQGAADQHNRIGDFGSGQVTSRDECSPGNQNKTERQAEFPAPRRILLDPHKCAKCEHPADIASANDEHQQHDCPAAADAEHTVMHAEQEGIAARRLASAG
jgi:hypothetical protein